MKLDPTANTELVDKQMANGSSSCPKCKNDISKSMNRRKLESWLNRNMKIEMADGRTLIGTFLCTDRDSNVILGSCSEYLRIDEGSEEEPRVLGLAMVPGHHIISVSIDNSNLQCLDIL